jgi:hypothetical protein
MIAASSVHSTRVRPDPSLAQCRHRLPVGWALVKMAIVGHAYTRERGLALGRSGPTQRRSVPWSSGDSEPSGRRR